MPTLPATKKSIRREAIEKTVATCLANILRSTSHCRMRRVPGARPRVVDRANTVVVTDHCSAFGAVLGPVTARHVWKECASKGGAIRTRAGEDVMLVRLFAAAIDHPAVLIQRRLLVQVVVRGMQVIDALRDHDALGVVPRARADPLTRMHDVRIVEFGALRAQVGPP